MNLEKFLPNQQSCLALAGVIQPLHWVHQIAAQGISRETRLDTTIQSILCVSPATALDVYGGELANVKDGLAALIQILEGRGEFLDAVEQPLLTRYTGQVLRLGVLLNRQRALSDRLANGLRRIQPAADDGGAVGSTADTRAQQRRQQVEALAQLYVENISPLKPRVMVSGQPGHLQNPRLVADLRCLLLGSLRSAVLWHQCGGRFWQLLFLRGAWLKQARQLAASAG